MSVSMRSVVSRSSSLSRCLAAAIAYASPIAGLYVAFNSEAASQRLAMYSVRPRYRRWSIWASACATDTFRAAMYRNSARLIVDIYPSRSPSYTRRASVQPCLRPAHQTRKRAAVRHRRRPSFIRLRWIRADTFGQIWNIDSKFTETGFEDGHWIRICKGCRFSVGC